MPTGSSAGVGPAGFDAPVVSPASNTTRTRALRYDLATRTFVEDGTGGFVSTDPIDQKVALLLGTEQGTVPSVPTLAQRYRKRVNGVDPKQIPAIVLDETRIVLAPLIAAGDIQLLDVQTDASFRTRVLIAVTYRNLRSGNANVFKIPI